MLQVLHMGLHVCQLMGYGQINDGLNLITHHSRDVEFAGLRHCRRKQRQPDYPAG